MKLKMGIIGSATTGSPNIDKANRIGQVIARNDFILVNGSGYGLPYEAAKGAKECGGFTLGISPAANMTEHLNAYKFPVASLDIIVFTGFGLKGRNVILVRTCDAVILMSGGMGTLNEFTIAFDEEKIIGVLEGTGGISDGIRTITKMADKSCDKIIFDSDPERLIARVSRRISAGK